MRKTIINVLQNIFLKLGERSAIILVMLASIFLIYSETATDAHSQTTTITFQRQEAQWYENDVQFKTAPAPENSSYSFTTAAVTPTPSPTPAPVTQAANSDTDIWEKLAQCESKGNWSINTGNGYYGGLQFSEGAWNSVGGTGLPSNAGRDEQIMRGKMLQEKRGWGPWGGCSKKLGLL